jgi:nickel-dependent lactate racemase
MRVLLRYGTAGLELEFPDAWDVTVLAKKRMALLADPRQAIAAALDAPAGALVGALPLSQAAAGCRTACILVCDITRPVPNGMILRPVIERLLGAGMHPAAITVLVATGLHRPNEGAELAAVIGDSWVFSHSSVVNHFARRDEDHAHLGVTSQGIPIRLDRRLVEADIRVAVGLVEPHFMAGWSGGRKLVVPGVAHADTITAFHAARMLAHPRATACKLSGNPLHEAQREALGMLGKALAVSVVIDESRQLAFVSFGGIEESLAAAVAYAEPYARVRVPHAFPVVLASAAGAPLDATYYQTVKGICAGAAILESGGDLFVASECAEGLGSPEFRASQHRLRELGREGFRAEAAGRARADIDEWQTFMLLKALDRGTVHLHAPRLGPEDQALTGALPAADLPAALRAAVQRAEGRRLAVIPEGPYMAPWLGPENQGGSG